MIIYYVPGNIRRNRLMQYITAWNIIAISELNLFNAQIQSNKNFKQIKNLKDFKQLKRTM